MRTKKEDGKKPAPAADPPPASESKPETPPPAPDSQAAAREINIKRVVITDVGVKFSGLLSARVAVADIVHEDFTKEMGSSMGEDIFLIVLESICKSIVATAVGKSLADKIL